MTTAASNLPAELVEQARLAGTEADPAHDFGHVLRVCENVRRICTGEAVSERDTQVAVTAALLHELFNYPKQHPQSHLSGDVCAEHAAAALAQLDYEAPFIAAVSACIRDHGFSKGVTPDSLPARLLQDADRLDAIGAIGSHAGPQPVMPWALSFMRQRIRSATLERQMTSGLHRPFLSKAVAHRSDADTRTARQVANAASTCANFWRSCKTSCRRNNPNDEAAMLSQRQ